MKLSSFVYVIQSGDCFKIGITTGTSIETRLKALQCASPSVLKVAVVLAVAHNAALERRLHKRMETKRITGAGREWFNLTNKDVEWIKSLDKEFDLKRGEWVEEFDAKYPDTASAQRSYSSSAVAFREGINVREPARAVGIENANQLKRALQCSTGAAYDLWAETPALIHVKTVHKLCMALNCTANTIFRIKEHTNGKNKGRKEESSVIKQKARARK